MNKQKLIKKIRDVIEKYTKSVGYNLGCSGCRIELAQMIYERFEKEIKKHGDKKTR